MTHTPTTGYVRKTYSLGYLDGLLYDEQQAQQAENLAEFDQWLAQHDAEVAAKALRGAASAPIPRAVLASGLRQWLRERADRIEWEATSE